MEQLQEGFKFIHSCFTVKRITTESQILPHSLLKHFSPFQALPNNTCLARTNFLFINGTLEHIHLILSGFIFIPQE